MKKILLSILAAVISLPMIAIEKNKSSQNSDPVFHAWVSMWGPTIEPPKETPRDGSFAELPQLIEIPGVDAVSLGFMGWDEDASLFTAWNSTSNTFANEWLARPKLIKDKDGERIVINPWYWLWTYYKLQEPKIDYYMGAGGWSFGGGEVGGKNGPDIWKTLVKLQKAGIVEKLASNIADFVNSPSPVYSEWSWWASPSTKTIDPKGTLVNIAGINLDLESVDKDKGGPGEFSNEMLNAVADLIGHLKNKGVNKIIATVMVKDYYDNMLNLLTNHFDDFYEIHVMAYDMGTKEWQKEGYKTEMNAFAKAISKGGAKHIPIEKVKGKMVIGLSACEQFTNPEEMEDGKKIVEPIPQLEEKAKWIVDNGFKGTFMWAVGQTYLVKDRHPGYTETDIVKEIIRAMH